jgi:hypothetical protein
MGISVNLLCQANTIDEINGYSAPVATRQGQGFRNQLGVLGHRVRISSGSGS